MHHQSKVIFREVTSRVSFFYSLFLFCSVFCFSGCGVTTTAQLPDNVKSEVARLNPPVRGFSLDVSARSGGVVELSGYVNSESDRKRVVEAASRAHGVVTVDDKLKVQSAVAEGLENRSKFQDEIFQKLEDNLVGAQYLVSVIERSGDVVVQGSVDSQLTKGRVIEAVTTVVAGQARIVDELKLVAAPSDKWIADKVTEEIANRFPQWKQQIRVTGVRNGVVSIGGSLADHWDIDSVLAAVVMVPGVRDLRSELLIDGKPYSSDGVRVSSK